MAEQPEVHQLDVQFSLGNVKDKTTGKNFPRIVMSLSGLHLNDLNAIAGLNKDHVEMDFFSMRSTGKADIDLVSFGFHSGDDAAYILNNMIENGHVKSPAAARTSLIMARERLHAARNEQGLH